MTGGTSRRTGRRTKATWAAVITAAALFTMPAAAGPAEAGAPLAAKPRPAKTPEVQLQLLDQDVDAGASFDVRVKSKHLGKKAKVVLQHRKKGTRAWDDVAKVGKRGVSTVPGTGVGVYTYRVVVTKKGKTLTKSKGSQLRSYGNLSLQQYCAGAGGAGIHACADGTATVGSAPFAYHALANNLGTDASATPSADFTNSACGSITLRWALSDGASATTVSVSLSQEKGIATQTASAAAGTVGTTTFGIGSKNLSLRFWANGTGPVTWDATLNCFTTSGIR